MPKDFAGWASRWRVPLAFLLLPVLFILAQPRPLLLLAGGALALAGLLLRVWAAGHLDKNQSLATGGPYAYTRNPLYLGSALMGLGGALGSASWIMGLVFAVLFGLVYWPVMEREAQFLRRRFGEAYETYARQVPLFFPRLTRPAVARAPFEWRLYLQNREYEAAGGYVVIMFFLALKMWLR